MDKNDETRLVHLYSELRWFYNTHCTDDFERRLVCAVRALVRKVLLPDVGNAVLEVDDAESAA